MLTAECGLSIISFGDDASSHSTCRALHLQQQSTSLPDKPEEGADPREETPRPTDVSLGTNSFPKSTVQKKLNWQEPLNPTLLPNTAKPFTVTGRWHAPGSGLLLAWSTLVGTFHISEPDTANLQPPEKGREVQPYF